MLNLSFTAEALHGMLHEERHAHYMPVANGASLRDKGFCNPAPELSVFACVLR